jgi:hypothetical protein
MTGLIDDMDNQETDEIKLIQDSPTTSSSDNEADAGSCRDSISSEVYVRRPGMVKSMLRRLRVGCLTHLFTFKRHRTIAIKINAKSLMLIINFKAVFCWKIKRAFSLFSSAGHFPERFWSADFLISSNFVHHNFNAAQ